MASQYTVVQYVPNPLSDERINIGIVAWDDAGVSVEFISSWYRIRAFGNEDIGYVKDFVTKTSEAMKIQSQPDLFRSADRFDVALLEKMIGGWRHSIQFTTPRGSIKDRATVLRDVAPVYLSHRRLSRYMPRSRRTATKIAVQEVEKAVFARNPDFVDTLVKTNFEIPGACDVHNFPVALANGHPAAVIETLSFEIQEKRALELEIDSVCWACTDVRKQYRRLALAVFALEPKGKSELFDRAGRVLRKLDIPLVNENSIGRWATKQAVAVVPLASQRVGRNSVIN